MPEPALDRPGVVALVGEGVAAGVPQHVGMGLEFQPSGGSDGDAATYVAAGMPTPGEGDGEARVH